MSALMNFPTVSDRGVVTHVMVPVAEFEKLTGEHPSALEPPSPEDIEAAIAVYRDPKTKWHDAETLLVEVVRNGIEGVRRSHGLTQADLGKATGFSQSQISRMEKNPDTASLGLLKRIAEALANIRARNL